MTTHRSGRAEVKAELARQTGKRGGGPVTLFVMYLTIVLNKEHVRDRFCASLQKDGTGKGPDYPGNSHGYQYWEMDGLRRCRVSSMESSHQEFCHQDEGLWSAFLGVGTKCVYCTFGYAWLHQKI